MAFGLPHSLHRRKVMLDGQEELWETDNGGMDRRLCPPSIHTDAKERKERPVCTGALDYFPDAIMEVANCSLVGNKQHHEGTPLHWDKNKSTDEADALVRHLLQRGGFDTDGVRHSAKVAWRALALLQREIEGDDSE